MLIHESPKTEKHLVVYMYIHIYCVTHCVKNQHSVTFVHFLVISDCHISTTICENETFLGTVQGLFSVSQLSGYHNKI